MQIDFTLATVETERPQFTNKTLFHVGVSGGKDSAAALLWMIHESHIPREQIRATFCDIGNDHPWTLAHVKLLSETVHPIQTIYPDFGDLDASRSGERLGFFELALFKKRFPSTKARFCTEYLKIYVTQREVQRLKYEGWNVIAVNGVRADESDQRKNKPEWDYSANLFCYNWRPLIRWTVQDVFAIHNRHKIPLNPLYEIGAQRVGCWPCIMSRKAEIRIIALKFPERIDEIRKAEQEFENRYGRYASFFPAGSIPERFCTKPFKLKDGTWMNVATIDDVVRWSMTGERAQGSYLDDEPVKEPISCNSGFCE